MASALHSNLQLPRLTRQSMSQLIAKAKRMGMAPEDYAKRLLEDGLALQNESEKMTFAEIMAPVRQAAGTVEEAEIVKLVDRARNAHHRCGGRASKKR